MSISMPVSFACGAAKRRDAAAKPAPRTKVFLKKSRLLFMVLPLQELENPVSSRNSMDMGYKRDAWRHQVAALAMRLLEGEKKTQMRRIEKDAARAGNRTGGPLSKLHAAVKSGARNSAAVSRTTAPLRTTVTCGTTFLQTLRRSAVTQFVRHDCDINIALMASTGG
jgi:hypothetical protein